MDHRRDKIAPELLRRWQAAPGQEVQAILRVTEVTDQVVAAVERAGLQIRQRTQLVPTLAVQGPAQGVLSLLSEPWLVSVEEDRPVRAL